ncbi:hypothetical protein [Mucilaginibacter myungsuensis]|uniref:Uncharacterized protein n=1 Tax=Mucilaginibacter myungsuensis TaxID=649104 RepID=A0A929KWE4_9SPHI|nr:hypothetical protein [Mucilaginibacter myungsuensis]MBE9661922.1 hypothetical protein [Mucilaginibacter myungsuensis]MDN3599644.1 hypothetical protein [Mucilaginibacter myungsuensis]
MDFREYKRSAVRHLLTCQQLIDKSTILKQENKTAILLNVYYLSGYVVETCLSYAYFSHIKHQGPVENCKAYATDGFKTHRFDVKIKFIMGVNGDLNSIPFINNKSQFDKLNLLFNNWSTDYRYSATEKIKERDLTEELLTKYLEQLNILLETIFRRF